MALIVTVYRGLFTAGWFGVREKHYFWLKIYDRLRASEQAEAEESPNLALDWTPESRDVLLPFHGFVNFSL